jgi:hypothetical protein
MNFWEKLHEFLTEYSIDTGNELAEYSSKEFKDYNYVITIHREEEDIFIINLIETDKWEMILEIAEITEKDVSDIVQGLSDNEIHQLRLDTSKWDYDL